MAFSNLSRLQIVAPLGMRENGHGALVPRALTNGAQALTDQGGGVQALMDAEIEIPPEVEAGADDDFEDDISDPTEQEQADRQQQLDSQSSEFLQAYGLGIYNETGEQLYSDQTYRPEMPLPEDKPLMRPPTPPVPLGAEAYQLATGNTTPRSMARLTESSPDLTPKRQRLVDMTSPMIDELLTNAAEALETYGPKRKNKASKTIGKVASRTRSPRSGGTPHTGEDALMTTTPVVAMVPKAPPAHLVRERVERLAAIQRAADIAETATFGSQGFSPERVIQEATLNEQAAFIAPAPFIDTAPTA